MVEFKKWTTPASGQVRIYISGIVGQRSSKIFVVEKTVDQFGFEYDIVAQIPDGVCTRRADLVNDAEKAMFEAAGARVKKFEQVLQLCK